MTSVPARLKKARQAAGFRTATAAAARFVWNRHTYTSNENGHRPLSRDAAVAYARAFKVNLEWLLTGKGSMQPGSSGLQQVPILRLGGTNGGLPVTTRNQLQALLNAAEVIGYIAIPADQYSADKFAMMITDNYMDGPPLWLKEGDVVDTDPTLQPRPGSVVVVSLDAGFVVRKLGFGTRDKDGNPIGPVELHPLNPLCPIERGVSAEQVLSVVTGFYRKVPTTI